MIQAIRFLCRRSIQANELRLDNPMTRFTEPAPCEPTPASFEFSLACRAFACDSDLGHMDEPDLVKHLTGLINYGKHSDRVDNVKVTHIMHLAGDCNSNVIAGREIDFTVTATGETFDEDKEQEALKDAEYLIERKSCGGGFIEIEVLDCLSTTKIDG